MKQDVHILDFEPSNSVVCNDFFPELVLAHSLYTTTTSGTLRVEYQLDNMEKDLVQRYSLGKPIISGTLDIPQMYKERPQSDITRALVKCKVQQVYI